MSNFTLILSTTSPAAAELRLLDGDGIQLGFHAVDFAQQPVSLSEGAFNLRDYVRHGQGTVAQIAEFIAKTLLGGLFPHLAQGHHERVLTVQLPDPSADNPLAAALARIPWEIARADPDSPSLAETNLQVRAAATVQPAAQALPLQPDQPVRVLLVFAEAPGSTPLAMRQERHDLLKLFAQDIFPKRKVELDVLAHGVTRQRLQAQIESKGGYHLLHWSGHGHIDCLELYREGGGAERLSGLELAQLFERAGGYIPQLVFLSACHSGSVGAIRNWQQFHAHVTGQSDPQRESKPLPEQLAAQPGYTGTARRLLQAGTPAVVAMRYAVGDDYARDLAKQFYRHLLADAQAKPAAAALNLARKNLLERGNRDREAGYGECDHATPILHGENLPLNPPTGRAAPNHARAWRKRNSASANTRISLAASTPWRRWGNGLATAKPPPSR